MLWVGWFFGRFNFLKLYIFCFILFFMVILYFILMKRFFSWLMICCKMWGCFWVIGVFGRVMLMVLVVNFVFKIVFFSWVCFFFSVVFNLLWILLVNFFIFGCLLVDRFFIFCKIEVNGFFFFNNLICMLLIWFRLLFCLIFFSFCWCNFFSCFFKFIKVFLFLMVKKKFCLKRDEVLWYYFSFW